MAWVRIAQSAGDKLGIVERRVTKDLENFKRLIEERGHPSGAWHGEDRSELCGLTPDFSGYDGRVDVDTGHPGPPKGAGAGFRRRVGAYIEKGLPWQT